MRSASVVEVTCAVGEMSAVALMAATEVELTSAVALMAGTAVVTSAVALMAATAGPRFGAVVMASRGECCAGGPAVDRQPAEPGGTAASPAGGSAVSVWPAV
jgi:hypothetical protein